MLLKQSDEEKHGYVSDSKYASQDERVLKHIRSLPGWNSRWPATGGADMENYTALHIVQVDVGKPDLVRGCGLRT